LYFVAVDPVGLLELVEVPELLPDPELPQAAANNAIEHTRAETQSRFMFPLVNHEFMCGPGKNIKYHVCDKRTRSRVLPGLIGLTTG
jgi:hypothetical protein